MPDRISIADRVAALAELEKIALSLNDAADWAASRDADGAAAMLEDAARLVAAAAWVLEIPVRSRAPGSFTAAVGEARSAAYGNGQAPEGAPAPR